MKLLFAILVTAHAGVFTSLCERCLGALVADDPHQFNEVSIDWLIASTEHLVIKSRWRQLNRYEASMLEIQLRELKLRASYGSDSERDRADEAVISLMR